MNPITPRITIPIAETFETCSNSSREGFRITLQTRWHFIPNDLMFCQSFTIIRKRVEGF